MRIYVLYLISLLYCQKIFSQNIDLPEDKLLGKPKSVIKTSYAQKERFGESEENITDITTLKFNVNGFLSEEQNINYPTKDIPKNTAFLNYWGLNYTKIFEYYPNSTCLKNIIIRKPDGDSRGKFFLCDNNHVIEESYQDEKGEHIFYYEYNNLGQKIGVKEYFKSLRYINQDKSLINISIIKYENNEKKIEESNYDNTGVFKNKCIYEFDESKNLLKKTFFQGKDYIKIESIYDYDLKKHLVAEKEIHYTCFSGKWRVESGGNESTIYKNDYYPNGMLKKKSKFWHFLNKSEDTPKEVEEYKSYDDKGNWTEKIIFNEKYSTSKYNRVTRQIIY